MPYTGRRVSVDRRAVFIVFSQYEGAIADIQGWDAHARRFFGTQLSLVDGRTADAGAVRIAPDGEASGIRVVHVRPREADDLALAEAADVAQTGLALLARRCRTVWLVTREAESDPLALRLAAIVASVVLGPILDVRVPELLGVKSARERLGGG
jgi:hypothetical protein